MENTIENLRTFLFNLELQEVTARGAIELHEEQYQLHSNLVGKRERAKAMQEKSCAEVYKVYLTSISEIKNRTLQNLNKVIGTYEPLNLEIWKDYFIKQISVEDIADKYALTKVKCAQIINKMKSDFNGLSK